MKKSSLGIIFLYLIIGIAFGLCFPLGAYVLVGNLEGIDFWSISDLHKSNNLLFMIDTAPLFLGLFSMIGGFSQAKIYRNNLKLNISIHELNDEKHINAEMLSELEAKSKNMAILLEQVQGTSSVLSANEPLLQETMDHIISSESGLRSSIDFSLSEIDAVRRNFDALVSQSEKDMTMMSEMNDLTERTYKHIKVQYKSEKDSNRAFKQNKERIHAVVDQIDMTKELVKVIQEVSNQIDLLALNASIESARAGEMGKGFIVVADEIKKLSSKTREATTDINNKVELLIDQVDEMEKEVDDALQGSLGLMDQWDDTISSVKNLEQDNKILLDDFLVCRNYIGDLDISFNEIENQFTRIGELAGELKSDVSQGNQALTKNNKQISHLKNHLNQMNIEE